MAQNHPTWAANRLLNFLNQARTAKAIYQHPDLKDDPNSGSTNGRTIGQKTAQKIIDHRKSNYYRPFRSLDDVLAVKGVGQETLNDLLFSFSDSADDAFIKALFSQVLGENWVMKQKTIDFDSKSDFEQVANNGENFRRTIAQHHAATFTRYSNIARRELEMRVHRALQVNYFDGHLGAFQFAFWWYLFDYDNWFSYDKIKEVCEQYLNHHGHGSNKMQFRVLHLDGYESIPEFQKGLVLPVVVNYPEQRITLWNVVLND